MTYEPIQNTPITGVGGLQAQAEGRSDVNIIVSYNGSSYPIHLCDVLYVPGKPNNLIKFRFCYAKHETCSYNVTYPTLTKPVLSWDTWHRCFGDIGYSRLKNLLNRQLVSGFDVDRSSPMSDCAACTEAKQSVIPFNKKGDQDTLPGELTHVDVWGKYDVASINGHSYYLLLIDDTSCYVTVQ